MLAYKAQFNRMKINLADYPPGCGKTLMLQHSPFRMLRGALIFSGLAYTMWLRGGHHTILILLLSIIAGIFYIITAILTVVNPMAGGVLIDENGLATYSILRKRAQFEWGNIHDIQLKCLGELKQVPLLMFKANGNKDYAIYIVFKQIEDKTEFVEWVKQWQQYYSKT